MKKAKRRGDAISLTWIFLGMVEWPWLLFNEHFISVRIKEGEIPFPTLIASLFYVCTFSFAVMGLLAGYWKLISFKIPSACSLAWGVAQILISVAYLIWGHFFSNWPLGPYLFFAIVWSGFGFLYIVAGLYGLFFLTRVTRPDATIINDIQHDKTLNAAK